jgi:hypothetical protein
LRRLPETVGGRRSAAAGVPARRADAIHICTGVRAPSDRSPAPTRWREGRSPRGAPAAARARSWPPCRARRRAAAPAPPRASPAPLPAVSLRSGTLGRTVVWVSLTSSRSWMVPPRVGRWSERDRTRARTATSPLTGTCGNLGFAWSRESAPLPTRPVNSPQTQTTGRTSPGRGPSAR